MGIILIFLFSCAKQKPIDHDMAVALFNNSDCLAVLEGFMRESQCPHLKYTSASPYDIMFRCHKPDEDRGEFWDNYIFRVSPANIQYTSAADRKLVEDHTICIDDTNRIEAYEPTMINM